MPLPAGFKIGGRKITNANAMPLPPRVLKVMAVLDRLPADELLTTCEMAARAKLTTTGATVCHPDLADYREKVDGKMYWGSREGIAQLRKQLTEDTNDEN